jgi:hypothetical protein
LRNDLTKKHLKNNNKSNTTIINTSKWNSENKIRNSKKKVFKTKQLSADDTEKEMHFNLVGVLKYSLLPRFVDFPAEEHPVRGHPASRKQRSSFVDFHQLGNDRILHRNSLLDHTKELAVSETFETTSVSKP